MKIGGNLKLFKIFPLQRFTSNSTDTNKKRSIRHYANLRFRILFKTGDGEDHQILHVNPEKPDVPLNKNDAFQKVQKRRVQEKR